MPNAEYQVEIRAPVADELGPELRGVFEYWRELAGDSFAPAWRDFDWFRMPAESIPWCSVVDVQRDPLDFIYRFWGTARTRLQGSDYTGKAVSTFEPVTIRDKAFAEYCDILEQRRPLWIVTRGLASENCEPFGYEFLRLPFSTDGVEVDKILGVGIYGGAAFKAAFKYYGTEARGRVL